LFGSLLAPLAHAQSTATRCAPTQADTDTARSAYEAGDRARAKGEHEAALASYQAADALVCNPATGFRVAETLMALHRLVAARAKFLEVVAAQPSAKAPDPFAEWRTRAGEEAERLRALIPTLRIVLDLPPGLVASLTIDGKDIPGQAMFVAHTLDPGKHEVRVLSEGAVLATQTVTLDERTHAIAQFVLSRLAAAAPLAIMAKSNPRSKSEPSDPVPVALLASGFTLAGAGLMLGTIAGVAALNADARARANCQDPSCSASAADSARSLSLAHASTAGFIAAGVGGALGISGIVLMARAKRRDSGAVLLGLSAPGQVELRGTF
jgi:hypothetical protein